MRHRDIESIEAELFQCHPQWDCDRIPALQDERTAALRTRIAELEAERDRLTEIESGIKQMLREGQHDQTTHDKLWSLLNGGE